MAARAGFEPTALRSTGIDSTNEPPIAYWYCIASWFVDKPQLLHWYQLHCNVPATGTLCMCGVYTCCCTCTVGAIVDQRWKRCVDFSSTFVAPHYMSRYIKARLSSEYDAPRQQLMAITHSISIHFINTHTLHYIKLYSLIESKHLLHL